MTDKEALEVGLQIYNNHVSEKEMVQLKDGTPFGKVDEKVFVEYIKMANEAIAEKINNRWIPVTERLPEDNKDVLCWVKSTTISSGETYILGTCDRGFWFLKTYNIGSVSFPVRDYVVVAWRPLPEQYKESD